ncbi:MAG: SdpI family protein [Phormidesmis sp.]
MKLKRTLLINLTIIAAMLALSLWAWIQLPTNSQIPMHFDATGVPDRYAGKSGLLELPAVALGLSLLFVVVPSIEPLQKNIQRSHKAYTASSIIAVAAIATIHTAITFIALGQPVSIPNVVNIVIGLTFIVTGNYASKIRRNFFFGFRTPWTLSSERAWHKTHRLGSWLLLPHGVAFFAAGLLSASFLVTCVLTVSLIVSLLLVLPVYSYQIWKTDPNRLTQ